VLNEQHQLTASERRTRLLIVGGGGIPLVALLTYAGVQGFDAVDLIVAAVMSLAVASLFLFLSTLRSGGSAIGWRTWLFAVIGLVAGIAFSRLTGRSHVKGVQLVGATWGFAVAVAYALVRDHLRREAVSRGD
jgi:drug/metabolite transporter (DMT)-like permease